MKKLIGALMITGVSLIALAPTVGAAQGNPHQEEQDGCDHGNTGKPCKDDPQPDKGKDCEVHGNHGGINEDHCAGTTTTTAPPTTTTTQPEPTTTTTVPEQPTTTTTQPEVTVTTQPAPAGNPAVPASDTPAPAPAVEAQPQVQPPAVPVPAEQLPHTGAGSLVLAMYGAGLLCMGIAIKAAVSFI